jgi:hypothetical protein
MHGQLGWLWFGAWGDLYTAIYRKLDGGKVQMEMEIG